MTWKENTVIWISRS